MIKKIVAMLLLAAMLVGALAGCQITLGGGDATNPDGAVTPTVSVAGGYDGSEVTLTFYHSMGKRLTDVLDPYVEEFNKIYPNIHIEYEGFSTYDDVRDAISTELTAGNQPNLAYCYPDHVATYNIAGAVAQLDTFIESQESDGAGGILGLTQEQKDNFIQGYYNEGAVFGDGKMYTLPLSKSTELMYYNKTFFEEHNLEVPKTWDELETLCKTIKEIDPECIPLGYDSEANWFITMCEQLGSPYTSATGDHFLFNNEENRAFAERFNRWYQEGYLTTEALYGNYTSNLFKVTSGRRTYISIGSSAGATYQRPDADNDGKRPFDVGIAMTPQVDPANPKVISQGPNLCIFNKSNPQEVIASWLLVKFLTTNVDFQAEFSYVSGYMPVLKSCTDLQWYADHLAAADGGDNISALAVKVALENEAAYFTSPAFNGSSEARDQVGSLLTKCLTLDGEDVAGQILKEFEKSVEECSYRYGK